MLQDPAFLSNMLEEMDNMSTGDVIAEDGDEEADGQISRDEFLAWYLQKGCYYLDKPAFQNMKLHVPRMKDRAALFKQMDDDDSGELNYLEVSEAVNKLWPQVSKTQELSTFSPPLPLWRVCPQER